MTTAIVPYNPFSQTPIYIQYVKEMFWHGVVYSTSFEILVWDENKNQVK